MNIISGGGGAYHMKITAKLVVAVTVRNGRSYLGRLVRKTSMFIRKGPFRLWVTKYLQHLLDEN